MIVGWKWHEASCGLPCGFDLHVLAASPPNNSGRREPSSTKGSLMAPNPSIKRVSNPRHCLSQHRLYRMVSFLCPQCDRRCKSLSGLTRHQVSIHQNNPGLSIPVNELRKVYHPSLNGTYKGLLYHYALLILRRPALRSTRRISSPQCPTRTTTHEGERRLVAFHVACWFRACRVPLYRGRAFAEKN